MMRTDAFNFLIYPVRTELTALFLTFILLMRKNKRASLCTKLYRRFVLRTRTDKKASSSTKIYCRAVLRTRTNYILQRKTNQNALIQKNTQIIRLHMMCQTILTPLTYYNAEEMFLTHLKCHT